MSEVQTDIQSYGGRRRRISLLALVAVNLIPLLGVFFFSWDVAALVILYWSENLVLGFYTILKMLANSPLVGIGRSLFFLIHYGGFCGIHGVFLLSMLMDGAVNPFPDDPWPLFLVFPQILFHVAGQVLDMAPPEWRLAFSALFFSHGISYVLNFLRGPERHELTGKQLMGAPYGRIVVLHIAIILGGFAVMALGESVLLLAVLVGLKLAMDVSLHLREHRGKTG